VIARNVPSIAKLSCLPNECSRTPLRANTKVTGTKLPCCARVPSCPTADSRCRAASRFLEYEDPSSAEKAIQHMNGFSLGGRQLRVNSATASSSAYANPHSPFPTAFPPLLPGAMAGPQTPAAVAAAAAAAAAAVNASLPGMQQPARESSLSSEEEMSISGNQRYLIMQKLARSNPDLAVHLPTNLIRRGTTERREDTAYQTNHAQKARVVRLRNMVDIEDLDGNLEEEVFRYLTIAPTCSDASTLN